jgi:hypothetical protein
VPLAAGDRGPVEAAFQKKLLRASRFTLGRSAVVVAVTVTVVVVVAGGVCEKGPQGSVAERLHSDEDEAEDEDEHEDGKGVMSDVFYVGALFELCYV